MKSPQTCNAFFIFDVESIGLHGQAFAVAGGIYRRDGEPIQEFAFHCNPDRADGEWADRQWVEEHVTVNLMSDSFTSPKMVRSKFWQEWIDAKAAWPDIEMFVECGWPVEARFFNACIDDDREARKWLGPYPLHEVATVMIVAGMDPMETYERRPRELPAHEPLADSRLSARLLAEALDAITLRP